MSTLTTDEVKTFISEVRSKGSILPEVDIEKYVCETVFVSDIIFQRK